MVPQQLQCRIMRSDILETALRDSSISFLASRDEMTVHLVKTQADSITFPRDNGETFDCSPARGGEVRLYALPLVLAVYNSRIELSTIGR